jgi:hypothetical protein
LKSYASFPSLHPPLFAFADRYPCKRSAISAEKDKKDGGGIFRKAGPIIIAKECHQRDEEKSEDKSNQNIFNYSFLRKDLENSHIPSLLPV